MAEQKNPSPSEVNQPMCSHCQRQISDIIQYVENLNQGVLRGGGMKKEDIKCLGCGAMGSCKTDDEKLLDREKVKKLLEEMMKKFPLMVAVESEADKGNFGFDIFCTGCPATFNDVEAAKQHFESNVH